MIKNSNNFLITTKRLLIGLAKKIRKKDKFKYNFDRNHGQSKVYNPNKSNKNSKKSYKNNIKDHSIHKFKYKLADNSKEYKKYDKMSNKGS